MSRESPGHWMQLQLEVTATHRKDKSPWRPGSAGRRRRRIPPSRPHCMSSVSPSPVARTSLSPAALPAVLLPDAGDDCACPGPAENYEEEEDEEDLESLASSVPSELQEDAGTTGLSQALTEQGFPPGGADLSGCRELIRSAASLSAEPEAESVLDGAVLGFPGAQPRLPALAQTVSPLLAGPSALKPRMSERKLLFSKWRVMCSFSGLQLRVQRSEADRSKGHQQARCLTRTPFLIRPWPFLFVSPRARRQLSGVFYVGPHPIQEGSALRNESLPKGPIFY
ncbi:uncharacterized protein LOC123629888 [Lemur catta]|uniref:uncharacterized protein LOC123629888 n=1 Tax=Lemur catta TaxID=9447 RepID=UPI001E26DB8C|nr:uncharacterized protein LOC123629888 [Lemur catta]